MVDIFALVLTHGLMVIAVWRIIGRDALDREAPTTPGTTSSEVEQTGA